MIRKCATSARLLLGLLVRSGASACNNDRVGPEDETTIPIAPGPQFIIAPVSVSVTGGVAAGGEAVILTLTADGNRLAPHTRRRGHPRPGRPWPPSLMPTDHGPTSGLAMPFL